MAVVSTMSLTTATFFYVKTNAKEDEEAEAALTSYVFIESVLPPKYESEFLKTWSLILVCFVLPQTHQNLISQLHIGFLIWGAHNNRFNGITHDT